MGGRETAILITLIAYKVVLLGIGLLAQARTHDTADFFLGGRRLGPVVAAVSASASSSSAWTLLGVSGFAYTYGLSAVWIFPSCVGGFALNWYVLAPRLRRLAADTGAITVTQLLAGPRGAPGARAVTVFASVIVLFSLLIYVASQFQGAGKAFVQAFGMSETASVLLGAGIVMLYTLLGGFWAVSLTDTLQGLVMAATAVSLPVTALVAVGGPAELWSGLAGVDVDGYADWFGRAEGAAALGFVLGLLGIGLGYPGQPHVVNRFMALRDDRAVVQAQRVAMTWAVLVYGGMIGLGLCGRVLVVDLPDTEKILMATAGQLFHPIVEGVMIAAVLSAIMSTADSQLLVAAAAVSHDLGAAGTRTDAVLLRSRAVVFALSAGAVVAALYGTQEIFDRVLFAWTAMGAAFGPLLLLRTWRGPLPPPVTLAAMVTGFSLAVIPYLFPLGLSAELDGVAKRIVPFVAAFAVAAGGLRRQR